MTKKTKIGKGGYGSAYTRGNIVSKYQLFGPNAKREYATLKIATYKGLASVPRLIKATRKPSTHAFKRGVPPPPKNLKNYNINASTGKPYISKIQMEFIKGKPLRNYYTGKPLPKALKNAVKNAIQEIHSAGIIHGDLHADNVIVLQTGPNAYKAYLIDFGKSIIRTSKQGGGFASANNANAYLKSLATKPNGTLNYVNHWTGKKFYRARKNRDGNGHTHSLNGNFLRRMI